MCLLVALPGGVRVLLLELELELPEELPVLLLVGLLVFVERGRGLEAPVHYEGVVQNGETCSRTRAAHTPANDKEKDILSI
ncbi:hypothetical protein CEXT_478251 [Caerostris extrusa]|uniref:Secreted protein n=1 Tax=Caerostris extrusa TaxID=172846 RepID=A0AAV4TBK8_CAEEX|nr:hypothetical protein CEXT_478251 [Caerostris extrusa]